MKSDDLDSVMCSGCDSPYHAECASLLTILPSGAFSKCCRANVDSSPCMDVPPTLSDIREMFRSDAFTLQMQQENKWKNCFVRSFVLNLRMFKESFRSEVSLLRGEFREQIGAIKDSVLQFSVNLGDR